MSVSIRLKRIGRPHAPFYRLVAVDSRRSVAAAPIEVLGTFRAKRTLPPDVLHVERVRYWLSVGAKMTNAVSDVLKKSGAWSQIRPAEPSAQTPA